ncbi:MFS transporter [Paenibacillus rhizoplanae]
MSGPPAPDRAAAAEAGTTRRLSLPYKGKQWVVLGLFILFFFLYVGTEMSLVNFMPAIFIAKLGMSEAAAALTVTFFWLAMSAGRLFAGVIAEKISYRIYVLVSCFAALLLLVIFPVRRSPACRLCHHPAAWPVHVRHLLDRAGLLQQAAARRGRIHAEHYDRLRRNRRRGAAAADRLVHGSYADCPDVGVIGRFCRPFIPAKCDRLENRVI